WLAEMKGFDRTRLDRDLGREIGALCGGGRESKEGRREDRGVAWTERKRNPGPRAPHFATLHAGYGAFNAAVAAPEHGAARGARARRKARRAFRSSRRRAPRRRRW